MARSLHFRGLLRSLPWLSLPAESGELGLGLWLIFVLVALSPLAYRSLVSLGLLQDVITPRDVVAPGLRWHLVRFLWLLLALYKK